MAILAESFTAALLDSVGLAAAEVDPDPPVGSWADDRSGAGPVVLYE